MVAARGAARVLLLPLLRWLPAAEAAGSAAAAVDEPPCGLAGSCPARGPAAPGMVLLQREDVLSKVLAGSAEARPGRSVEVHELPAATRRPIEEKDPSMGGQVPLCHHSVVGRTCRRLTGTSKGSITKEQIRGSLASNESLVESVWSALGFEPSEASVECMALCQAVVDYVQSVGGSLPPYSDMGCYTVEGMTSCDVHLNPAELTKAMQSVEDEPLPDDGAKVVNGTVALAQKSVLSEPAAGSPAGAAGSPTLQARPVGLGLRQISSGGAGRVAARESSYVPYTLWEAAERIAFLFRIFPSSGEDLPVASGGGAGLLQAGQGLGRSAQQELAVSDLRAKAWVSAVIGELSAWRTGSFRAKWFGGYGSLSETQVRERIARSMNFIERELTDGIRYVYPADQAASSQCQGTVVGYVWKYVSNEQGYSETQGPRCSSWDDPMTKNCGIDESGRYFVYLCSRWYTAMDENFRIATLVHEAAHHAGPGDVTYDKNLMQQKSQADQLNNAANYQNFAQDVAQSAWGCPDSEAVTGLPYSCGAQPCTCAAFANMCDDAQHGASIRQQCPATCGECTGPGSTPAASPSPTPAPSAPAPSPTPPTGGSGGCSEPEGTFELSVSGTPYKASCLSFQQYDFCGYAEVMAACPVSCGSCAPAGCQEDPTYDCAGWRGWECVESVKPLCPVTCGVPGCSR